MNTKQITAGMCSQYTSISSVSADYNVWHIKKGRLHPKEYAKLVTVHCLALHFMVVNKHYLNLKGIDSDRLQMATDVQKGVKSARNICRTEDNMECRSIKHFLQSTPQLFNTCGRRWFKTGLLNHFGCSS